MLADLSSRGVELTPDEIDALMRADARMWLWSPELLLPGIEIALKALERWRVRHGGLACTGEEVRQPCTERVCSRQCAADYRLRLHRANRVVLLADVFNLFNQQTALDYDPDT
jgi:hypothetical protein